MLVAEFLQRRSTLPRRPQIEACSQRNRRKTALVATALPIAAAGAHEGPDLTPATVTENVALGGTFDVEKTVHTPPIPPIVRRNGFVPDAARLAAS